VRAVTKSDHAYVVIIRRINALLLKENVRGRGSSDVVRLPVLVHLYSMSSPFESNLGGLGSIVGLCHFFEPRVVESLLSSNALGRIVYKYFS
jgi:hypothetical protein